MADRADIHRLYENTVQCPEADVEFFADTFKRLRGRRAKVLREDFCGTAKLAVTWCLSGPDRRALGVDLDPAVLEWGRQRNIEPHRDKLKRRLTIVQGNVLDKHAPGTIDVTCANNFSFCIFKERPTLKRYLRRAYEGLKSDGLLFLEIYGGTEAIATLEEEREHGRFTYVWDQHAFNPLTAETLCYIHYRFNDGSKREQAFTYDWRLWSVPELRDLLLEVGFKSVRIYWETVGETDDEDDDVLRGTGEYEEVSEVEQQESWLAYVVGVK